MLDQIWTTAKAVFGLGLLVGCALYAAQKLDRQHAGRLAEVAPDAATETTGSITPAFPGPGTQTPSR